MTIDGRYDVFLSHSSSDKPIVRQLRDALLALGLRVFFDEEELTVGDSLYKSLNDCLEASDYVVFCISRDSVASGWVNLEIGGMLSDQIKSRHKRILPVLLDDAKPPTLLSDLVWLDMSEASPTEVAAQIQRAISTPRSRAAVDSADVRRRVDDALRLLAGERAAPNFCWAIISGPSSAGKDVLSYIAHQRLQTRYGLEFLQKFTTRPRRPSEPAYVKQIKDAEFERKRVSGEIMFPFRKRQFWYGFDARQFREALREGTPLLSIFTEFKLVPAVVESMNASGVRTTAFLIKTEREDVRRRVLFRNLPPGEVQSRIASIEQDYEEMARRPTLQSEYVFIDNGDSTPFRDASETLTNAIQQMAEGTFSMNRAVP